MKKNIPFWLTVPVQFKCIDSAKSVTPVQCKLHIVIIRFLLFSRSIWNWFALVSFLKSWNWTVALVEAVRAISAFLKNSFVQINSKLNSKPYVCLYKYHALIKLIIQISYTVRISIFRLVDLYHVALGYDETTSLTSLSWCNTRGVNSIHRCHYTMASADSKFDDFCLQCIQFD